jgi:soluble lytic murein transglycosylase
MGRGWRAVGCLIGLITAAGASAGGELPTRPAESREPADVARLQALLAERESELDAIRDRVRVVDDEQRWHAEAESLGILEAVHRSALTERAQRRVAIAIVREAQANGLDPLLVVAVIRAESAFDAYAVSGVGAMGLMQMMPTTGTLLATQRGTALRHRRTLFDAELNVELGTAYLAALLRQFGTTESALLAYNAGPTLARRILRNPTARRRFLAGYPQDVISEWKKLRVRHDAVVARRELTATDKAVAESRLRTAE